MSCYARTQESRASFRAQFGLDDEATSLAELLADERVEAVVIATPNDLHVEHATAALQAGKPALIDKPLGVGIAEGLDLLRRSQASTTNLGVAHYARRLAGHRAARAWLASPDAGQVVMAQANFSNPRATAMSPDAWHRHARGSQAGVLVQVGIHHIDNLLWLCGPARAVSARFGYGELGPKMPITAVAVIEHMRGAVSTVASSWVTPGHYRMDLLATGGNLSYRLDHRQWTSPNVDNASHLTLDEDGNARPFPWTKGDPLLQQLDELGATARNASAMEVGVVDGLRAVIVVEAAVRSADEGGRRVDISSLLDHEGATAEEVSLISVQASN